MSVRTVTNARRVGVQLQRKSASTHRHARVDCENPTEKGEQTGSWVRHVAQAMDEQSKEDQQELETRKKKRNVEDAKRTRGIVRENDKNKDLSHVHSEMGNLMHHDEQELLSVWEGWHWKTKVGGLIRSCALKPGERKKEYIRRRHRMYTRVSRGTCLRETGRAPIKTGWVETDKDRCQL